MLHGAGVLVMQGFSQKLFTCKKIKNVHFQFSFLRCAIASVVPMDTTTYGALIFVTHLALWVALQAQM